MLATERAPRVQPVVLEGRHVRLVPLEVGHARELLAAASGRRETYEFTMVPSDEPSMVGYIESALRDQEAGRALPFATVAKATGRVGFTMQITPEGKIENLHAADNTLNSSDVAVCLQDMIRKWVVPAPGQTTEFAYAYEFRPD